jgi:hypothetical protein
MNVTRSGGDSMAAIVFQTNKDTGITYAYESVSYWDKEKQQSRARRKLIGKVDQETGEIVPTRKSLPSEETDSPKRRGPKTTDVCARTFYGATYLLNAIGDKMGITRDLKTCFPDTYKPILSLAYYMILEKKEVHCIASLNGLPFIIILMGRKSLPNAAANYSSPYLKRTSNISSGDKANVVVKQNISLTIRPVFLLIQIH